MGALVSAMGRRLSALALSTSMAKPASMRLMVPSAQCQTTQTVGISTVETSVSTQLGAGMAMSAAAMGVE